MNVLYRKNKKWNTVIFTSSDTGFETNFKNAVSEKYPELKDNTLDIVDIKCENINSAQDFSSFIVFFAIID